MGPILADGAAVVVGSAGPRCSTRLVPGGAPLSEEAFAGTLRSIVGLRRTRKYSRENATGQALIAAIGLLLTVVFVSLPPWPAGV